jgi:hypothetical protein
MMVMPENQHHSIILKEQQYMPNMTQWSKADYFVAEFSIEFVEYTMFYICPTNKEYFCQNASLREHIERIKIKEYMIIFDGKEFIKLNPNTGDDDDENEKTEVRIAKAEARIAELETKMEKLKEAEAEPENCCICLDDFEKCKWRCSTCNAGLICKGCHTKIKGVRKCPVCRTAPRHNKKK